MLRTVKPHDLGAACAKSGIDIEVLSQETGIPVGELVRFAAGLHALCARDRFAILETLSERSPKRLPRRSDIDRSTEAFRVLMQEVVEEDAEADAELDQ